jgi:hypothetical protein
MTLTVSGVATKMASRAGCKSSADDMSAKPATAADCPAGMPIGNYTYAIANGTLTTTDARGGAATYTLSGN